MEYLMTYGWAILIIAVVLGAIYSLGLFNGAMLGPKASPGSCQVLRPNGALTTTYISLEGTCTNELPQYVGQFNGTSTMVNVPFAQALDPQSMTMSVWAKAGSPLGGNEGVLTDKADALHGLNIQFGTIQRIAALDDASIYIQTSYQPAVGTWYYVAVTYNSTTQNNVLYVNGVKVANAIQALAYYPGTGYYNTFQIGNFYTNPVCSGCLLGSISNVQFYNNSLDANSILALYQEGIGGAPINLQSLIGWWPLNGNANDYSGNLNNGVPTSVVYTNQWLSGYTVP